MTDGRPDFASITTLRGAPSKLRLGGAFDFFHHTQAVTTITDFQPTMRDNKNLIWGNEEWAVSQDGPRSCPKAIFSAI